MGNWGLISPPISGVMGPYVYELVTGPTLYRSKHLSSQGIWKTLSISDLFSTFTTLSQERQVVHETAMHLGLTAHTEGEKSVKKNLVIGVVVFPAGDWWFGNFIFQSEPEGYQVIPPED